MHLSLSRFRPRFTVRRLMIAVANLALAIGESRRRHYEYLRVADWHASRTYEHAVRAGSLAVGFYWWNLKGEFVSEKEKSFPSQANNNWHVLMNEKYKWAARYP